MALRFNEEYKQEGKQLPRGVVATLNKLIDYAGKASPKADRTTVARYAHAIVGMHNAVSDSPMLTGSGGSHIWVSLDKGDDTTIHDRVLIIYLEDAVV